MALVGAQFVNAVSPNPVGSLQAFAGASAPTGWLLCDGTSYSTSVYPELFSVLDYTYGGSAGNFNVPDLRGRMPIGSGKDGTAANNATRTRGTKGGDTRMQQHNHNVQENSGNGSILGGHFTGAGQTASYAGNISSTAYPVVVTNAGSGSGDNMPPFLVTNYIIKAVPDAPRSGLAYGSTPPIVTQLPSNPQFGDVVTYIADATNGVAWSLQYDGSGSYPWKFVGGSSLHKWTNTGTAILTTGYVVDANFTGFTIPLAGDYTVETTALGYNSTAFNWWLWKPNGCSYPTGDQYGARVSQANAGNYEVASNITRVTLTTGTLNAVGRVVGGTGQVADRSITATPVRVAA